MKLTDLVPRWHRLQLRSTSTDELYLDRWGFRWLTRAIYLHHIGGPDPDRDPHTHPWAFRSFILRGGYVERWWQKATATPGTRIHEALSSHRMELGEAHQITSVMPGTWTLVVTGPKSDRWGFYAYPVDNSIDPRGFVHWRDYDESKGDERALYVAKSGGVT